MNMRTDVSTEAASPVDLHMLGGAKSDGIKAVERYRSANRAFDEIYDKLDEAQGIASRVHGFRPIALIAWRNCSAIGAGEIEQMRDRLLESGEQARVVEKEYKAAKKRYRDMIEAGKAWDQKTGLQALAQELENSRSELDAARKAVGSLKPVSLEEAAALIGLVQEGVQQFENIERWEASALASANSFLSAYAR